METQINRGDIYFAKLDPVIGSEQGGIRPVLILQQNKGNQTGPTVIAAAITGQANKRPDLPTHIPVECESLEKDSVVLIEQIRTLDKTRLLRYIGTASDETMAAVGKAIQYNMGVE